MPVIPIVLNGAHLEVRDGCDIPAVLDAAGVPADRRRGIAVALNHVVVPRSRWESATISEGDRIEIVTAVQGG